MIVVSSTALPQTAPPEEASPVVESRTTGLDLQTRPAVQDLRCAVCGDGLLPGTCECCPACEAPVHHDCQEYIGGCPRFACTEAAHPRRRLIAFLSLRLEDRIWSRGFALLYAFLFEAVLLGAGLAIPRLVAATFVLGSIWVGVPFFRRLALLGGHISPRGMAGLVARELSIWTHVDKEPAKPGLLPLVSRYEVRTLFHVHGRILGICIAAMVLPALLGSTFIAVALHLLLTGLKVFLAVGLTLLLAFPFRWLVWKQHAMAYQSVKLLSYWKSELEDLVDNPLAPAMLGADSKALKPSHSDS